MSNQVRHTAWTNSPSFCADEEIRSPGTQDHRRLTVTEQWRSAWQASQLLCRDRIIVIMVIVIVEIVVVNGSKNHNSNNNNSYS